MNLTAARERLAADAARTDPPQTRNSTCQADDGAAREERAAVEVGSRLTPFGEAERIAKLLTACPWHCWFGPGRDAAEMERLAGGCLALRGEPDDPIEADALAGAVTVLEQGGSVLVADEHEGLFVRALMQLVALSGPAGGSA